jgi:hypothetical protein
MVSLSFSIWKCCGHIEMWVEEASKSEGRAVGHVTCTELVADWAFSLSKADQLAFLLSKSRSNRAGPCPGTSNEIDGWVFSFYDPFDMIGPAPVPLSLMFRSGIRPRTTILVVVRKARTPRTSCAPFTNKGKKASTRTTFLLRADVAKCLTLLVIVSCCCGRCSFVRA